MNNENETPEGPVKNPRYSQQAYGYLKKLWNTSTKNTRTESKQRSEKSSPTTLEAKPKEKAMLTKTQTEPKLGLATKVKAASRAKRIRVFIKENPNAKPAWVAETLGVERADVYAVRYADSKKKKAEKAKKAKKAKPTWALTYATTSKNSIAEKLNAGANGTSVADMVNHPPHYKVGGIETIQFIKAKLTKEEYIGYLRGNVLKYASRLGAKNNASEDAGKMAWYAKQLEQSMKG